MRWNVENRVKTLKTPAAGEENFRVLTHLSGPKSDQTPLFHLSGPAHLKKNDLLLYNITHRLAIWGDMRKLK